MSPVRMIDCALDREDLVLPEGELRAALGMLWHDPDGVLLGHAYDGVMWGQVRSGTLEVATDYFPEVGALLRTETLLDLRIFNGEHEIRIWRDGSRLQACRLTEDRTRQDYAGYQDRSYALLGKPRNPLAQATPFLILEGPAGQRHAPPGDPGPRSLVVRHYLESDPETGLLRIAEHRLLRLSE